MMTPSPTGHDVPDVQQLLHRLEVLEANAARAAQRRRRLQRWALAVVAVGTFAAGGVWAANGACPNGYPFCFSPDTPAIASQVNHNFAQVKEWLEAKVGPVTSSTLAAGAVTASGGVTVTGGGVTLAGDLVMNSGQFRGANGAGNLHLDTLGTGAKSIYFNWFNSANAVVFGNGNGTEVARVDTAGAATFTRATLSGVGGNVPHQCVVRAAPAAFNVGCLTDEVATGGGASCPSLFRIIESLPWGGSSDSQSWTNGQAAKGWRARCQVWGDNGAVIPPSTVFAICCRQ